MSLYVLVGPDGKVYDKTCATSPADVWTFAQWERAGVKGVPLSRKWYTHFDKRAARRLGWRVRKCKIVLEDE